MENLKGELMVLEAYGIKPNDSELGRIYGMDRRTIKKRRLKIENKKRGRKGGSILNDYKELIKTKLDLPGSNIKSVYMYIKMNLNQNIGKYSNFNKYINKDKEYFLSDKKELHLRFETEAGEQLQYDWKGPITLHTRSGKTITFYIFSVTLGFSRLHKFIYSEFMTLEIVEQCLINVFQEIGGLPKECLTDNMSSIVDYGANNFRKEFLQFAKDIGFKPKRCKKQSPETKGKDESCNRFVNWLIPYDGEFEEADELITIIRKIEKAVNLETNQTTGMPPLALFEKEKEYLQPLPKQELMDKYLDTMCPAKVSNTSLVYYKGVEYSVPQKFIGKTVKLNCIDNKLYIYYSKELIATHDISNKKFNYKEEHYIEGLTSVLKNKTSNEIEQIAKKNLELLGKISKIKKEGEY